MEILAARLRRDVDVPSGRNRHVVELRGKSSDHQVDHPMTLQGVKHPDDVDLKSGHSGAPNPAKSRRLRLGSRLAFEGGTIGGGK